jgi:hypothetical protein
LLAPRNEFLHHLAMLSTLVGCPYVLRLPFRRMAVEVRRDRLGDYFGHRLIHVKETSHSIEALTDSWNHQRIAHALQERFPDTATVEHSFPRARPPTSHHLGAKRCGSRPGRSTADHEHIAFVGILHDDHAALPMASTLATSAAFAAGTMIPGSWIARLKS